MQLRDYLRIARERWVMIVAVALVVAVLAAVASTQMTKQYASTARVFVSTTPNNSGDAYQGGLFSEQRVKSYADVISGLDLLQRVIDRLDLRTSAATLSRQVTATVEPDTVILLITVTDADPARAQAINEAVVSELRSFVAELETPPGRQNPLLKATVVQTPRLPTSPVSPQPVRNVGLGLLLGLLLGLAAALARELSDTSVKRREDVPALTDVPLLSTLPYDSDVRDHPLISSLPSHSPRAEAFRVLRTNLSFIDVDHVSKVFVVTSSVPVEGKSTTAANAAVALASAGQRVLLIDGDLRRPQVANLTGLEGSVGVTTVLVGAETLEHCIQRHHQSGLWVLTAGQIPPNPAELLQSQAMHELINRVRQQYDVVIVDAPPLLPVTDAAVLASQTDGAVLVVRHGRTTREQVGGAVDRLHGVGSAPLGVVLNMVPTSRRNGKVSYGYGYGYAPEYADRPPVPRPAHRS